MKLQKKNAGGRKSEQNPNYPQPKPSSVQSAAGCAHLESDSTAIIDVQELTIILSKNPRLRGMSHQSMTEFGELWRH